MLKRLTSISLHCSSPHPSSKQQQPSATPAATAAETSAAASLQPAEAERQRLSLRATPPHRRQRGEAAPASAAGQTLSGGVCVHSNARGPQRHAHQQPQQSQHRHDEQRPAIQYIADSLDERQLQRGF